MSDMNVSGGHDGKADAAYGKSPSQIKTEIWAWSIIHSALISQKNPKGESNSSSLTIIIYMFTANWDTFHCMDMMFNK